MHGFAIACSFRQTWEAGRNKLDYPAQNRLVTREKTQQYSLAPLDQQDLSQLQFPTPEIQKIRKIQLLIIPACPGQKTHGTNGEYPRTKRTNICPGEIATIKGRKTQGFYVVSRK